MKRFFTSDHHFFHENIIKYCNRPFKSVLEMNSLLISNWNSLISNKDEVYVLGDIVIGNKSQLKEILSSLNGKKILIKGNHDRFSNTALKDAGFNCVFKSLTIQVNNLTVLLNHYPYKPDNFINLDEEQKKFLNKRPDNNGTWLLHGHSHSKIALNKNSIDVGVDAWNYYPVSEERLISLMKSRANF
jgi:calcineurin-like phosphoesterase family protein